MLAADPRVSCAFIHRNRFRAGLSQGAEALVDSRREFHYNILGSLYTVCVRGGGNYSQRLFESMALGRIPIYVDTDSPLPLADVIDWDSLVLRVPVARVDDLASVVVEFHEREGSDALVDRQRRCRETWVNYLAKPTFYRRFAQELVDTHARTPGTDN